MTDTAKSLTTLQGLLANNVAGDISPQDLRDFLVTALGVYGSISCFEASTAQANPNTGAKLDCWTTNGNSHGTTPDQSDDSITVGVAGNYDVFFQASHSWNEANVEGAFRLRKNGTQQNYGCAHEIGTSGNVETVSFIASGITLAASDVLTVYVEADSATADITVEDAQFTVRMVG